MPQSRFQSLTPKGSSWTDYLPGRAIWDSEDYEREQAESRRKIEADEAYKNRPRIGAPSFSEKFGKFIRDPTEGIRNKIHELSGTERPLASDALSLFSQDYGPAGANPAGAAASVPVSIGRQASQSAAKKAVGNVARSAFHEVGQGTAVDAINELRSLGGTTDAIEAFGRGQGEGNIRRVANRAASGEVAPAGGVAGDTTIRSVLAKERQGRLARPESSPVVGPEAPAVHIPVEHQSAPRDTSTRVRAAEDHLRSLGVRTPVARQAVPREGGRAAEFQRQASGLYTKPGAGEIEPVTLESLLGPGRTRSEFPGYGGRDAGVSPKELWTSGSGQKYMRKAATHNADRTVFRNQGGNRAYGDNPVGEAQDVGSHAFVHSVHPRTPEAIPLVEGGTMQPLLDNKPIGEYPTLKSLASPNKHLTPNQAKMLTEDEILDHLVLNEDNHSNQFLLANDELVGVDKGFGNFGRAVNPNMSPNSIRDAQHFSSGPSNFIHRGAKDHGLANPDYARSFIRDKVQKIPESQVARSIRPYAKAKGMSDADAGGLTRNMMNRIQSLGPTWENYIRTFY